MIFKDGPICVPQVEYSNQEGKPYIVEVNPQMSAKLLYMVGLSDIGIMRQRIILGEVDKDPNYSDRRYGDFHPSTRTVTISTDAHWEMGQLAETSAGLLVEEFVPKALGISQKGPLIFRLFRRSKQELDPMELSKRGSSAYGFLTEWMQLALFPEDAKTLSGWLRRPTEVDAIRPLFFAAVNNEFRNTVVHELAHVGAYYRSLGKPPQVAFTNHESIAAFAHLTSFNSEWHCLASILPRGNVSI